LTGSHFGVFFDAKKSDDQFTFAFFVLLIGLLAVFGENFFVFADFQELSFNDRKLAKFFIRILNVEILFGATAFKALGAFGPAIGFWSKLRTKIGSGFAPRFGAGL
jgi:hypothetical protein